MSTQSFKVKSGLTLTPTDLTTLTNPQAGDLVCDINDSNKIKRYDAASASWVEVGSGGGVGGVDIFFVQDFESASLSSFTQTGLVLSQTDPLKGKVSAVLNHQAGVSPTNDQSFKQEIAVDRKFRGIPMVLRLDSKSDASQGNVTIKITDETNTVDLVASEQLQLSNDTAGKKTSVAFTIPATCQLISYTITALPESGKVTRIDDIICEIAETALLETAVEVPVVTGWQGYTPTFQGFGSPTNVEFEWRQVGENVEIRGKFTSGTTTAVEARVGLPAGLTSAGTSLIPSLQQIGAGNASAAVGRSASVLIEPSVTYMTFGYVEGGSGNWLTKANGNAISASSGSQSFFASVPCAGLSATTTKTIELTQSGLVQEVDSMIRLITGNGFGTTLTGVRRFSTPSSSVGVGVTYADSPTNGTSFTIDVSGVYDITYNDQTGATSSVAIYIVRNQTTYNANPADVLASDYTTGTNTVVTANFSGYLEAGTLIRCFADTPARITSNSAYASLTITQQGSLKQVSVNPNSKITIPTSELRMEGASTRGSTDTAIVRFDNVAKLRGDAFTVESDSVLGTRITMKKAGKLDVSANFLMPAVSQVSLTRNQATLTNPIPLSSEALQVADASVAGTRASLAWNGDVNIGDVIRITTSSNPTANSTNNFTLNFQEQEIQVSVTNTLPQFSESDSSVRVDTANGYGSFGTKIRRFSNVRDNIGTDIVYVDDAVNGASFTVRSAGTYSISYTDQFTSGTQFFGISKNASSLATDIQSLATAERLASSDNSAANQSSTCSWSGYLAAGDVIRAHTQGSASGTAPALSSFTISKVGKPNVTGVDVTPFVNVPQAVTSLLRFDGSVGKGSTDTAIVKFTTKTQSIGDAFNVTDTAANGTYVTMLKAGKLAVSCTITGSQTPLHISKNQAVLTSNPTLTEQLAATLTAVASNPATVSWEGDVQVGDKIRIATAATITAGYVTFSFTGNSDQILTAPETFSTDTASLTYASSSLYTLSTLANAPVGTYITFTYAANTNTRTQTTTRPTQTDADMNANGIQIFTRAYNAASTSGNPSAIAIQIGKGHKGVKIGAYTNTVGKITPANLDFYTSGANTEVGALIKDYSETTGILIIDAGYRSSTTNTTHVFIGSDQTNPNPIRLDVNASKNPALTGLGLGTVAARAVNTAGTSIANTGETTLTYDSAKTYDTHGALNTSTGIFTAPESGYYQASWGATWAVLAYAAGNLYYSILLKNGVRVALQNANEIAAVNTQNLSVGGSAGIYLVKGDTLSVALANSRTGGASALDTSAGSNFFSIHKTSIGTGN